MNYNVTVIPGDGIGPGIVREAKKVMDQVGTVYGHTFDHTEILVGGCSIDAHGVPLTDEALEAVRNSGAVLLGAVGGDVGNSRWCDVTLSLRLEVGFLAVRKGLGLFTNIRPAYLYKELAGAYPLKKEIIGDGSSTVIMRELTGGLYFGDRWAREVDGCIAVTDTLVYNEEEIRCIAVEAFDITMKRRKKVTSMDETNVPDFSRLWRKMVEEVAEDYPEIQLSHMLADSCVMQLIMDPGQSDMIPTESMLGDILSSEASMIIDSTGMLSSVSMNESKFGLYEPSHGPVPDIVGKDITSSLTTILSAAMLPHYSSDLDREAGAIESTIRSMLIEGYGTGGIMPGGYNQVRTVAMGDLIAVRIRQVDRISRPDRRIASADRSSGNWRFQTLDR